MKDLISIIMPAYNCEKTIKQSIDSVLKQNYCDWELLIINDGSTDNTLKIINEYQEYTKIKVINQKNAGPSSARNKGLEFANGKYITFLDSDDYLDENYIKVLIESIDNNDMVICNYYIFNNNGIYENKINKKNVNIYDKAHYGEMIYKLKNNNLLNTNWNKMYKLSIIKNNNLLFDTNYKNGEDIRFNYQYLKYANTVKIISDKLYYYKINENGLTHSNAENMIDRYIKLLSYECDYFYENNLNLRVIQKLLIKSIFIINDIDRCEKNDYISIYLKLDNNRNNIIKFIKNSLNNKTDVTLRIILKFYNFIRRR